MTKKNLVKSTMNLIPGALDQRIGTERKCCFALNYLFILFYVDVLEVFLPLVSAHWAYPE